MNLRDLDYLVAVADLGHFGKAAKHCNTSQPTLSMQLKKLEDYLGVTLFERTNKRVMITAVGKQIADYARAILRDAEAIKATATISKNPLAGDFRLGAFPTLAPYFLPQAVTHITQKLPKLRLLLVEEKTATLLDQLKSGLLDAAFIALPVLDDSLERSVIFEDPFYLAVPHQHAFARAKTIKQSDLAAERLLLLDDGHCLRHQALDVCSLIGTSEKQDFRATSLETLRQMVCSGIGITLMPRIALRENDGITYIPFEKPAISRTIGLVWRKTSHRKACIDLMVSSLRA